MAQPATGTVTFLFTDIEGSTRRWGQQPEATQHALARHDGILREVLDSRGGMVFTMMAAASAGRRGSDSGVR